MRKKWNLQGENESSAEGYWASYSDLMAGVLLVFAVAAASAWIEFTSQAPPESLTQWNEFLDTLCSDEQLKNDPAIRVDCDTGSLIIKDSALHYRLNETELKEEQKAILLRTVPQYLRIVRRLLTGNQDIKIEAIEVGGHTDSTGSYQVNVDISSQRARNVLLFLQSDEEMREFSQLLKEKGSSVGFADSRPPSGLSKRSGLWEEARRIEIQVHVNTASILKQVREYLNQLRLGTLKNTQSLSSK